MKSIWEKLSLFTLIASLAVSIGYLSFKSDIRLPESFLAPETGVPNSRFIASAPTVRIGFDEAEKRYTNVVTSFRIGDWVQKTSKGEIPKKVVQWVEEELERAVNERKLKGVFVYDTGGTDLNIHVTHNFGQNNASVYSLLYGAVMNALGKAKDEGLYIIPEGAPDVLVLPFEEQMRYLGVRAGDNIVTERAAESVVIAKGIGVGAGAANIKLYNLFARSESTPLQKLGLDRSPGFRFVVQRTEDILNGNPNPKEWEFVISEAVEYKDKNGKKRLTTEKNETTRLLALLSQPNEYQIVAVLPVEGGSLPANEPVATVVHQTVVRNGQVRLGDPIIIFRSQSGADAVGGIGNMLAKVNVVPGGKKGDRFVFTSPVDLKKARSAPPQGEGFFTVYGYQSRLDGVIPPEAVIDYHALNPYALWPFQKKARNLARPLITHQNDQPYLAPWAAEEMSEPHRHRLDSHFVAAPKETDKDPFLSKLQILIDAQSGKWTVVWDDKADMGGSLGHTIVPPFMIAVYRATLMEAIGNSQISDGNTLGFAKKGRVRQKENVGVGDDGHMVMLHPQDLYGKITHQLSFLVFTRAYLVATVNDKQLYGQGQDYQGPEALAAKKNPFFYSQLTPRFFELLREVMPREEIALGVVDKVEQAWREWLETGQTTVLPEPFSGNVSQQGIGSARYVLDLSQGNTFDIIAGDKMGPPGFNRLIRVTVEDAIKAKAFKNGLVYEIWDLKAFDENGNIALRDLQRFFEDVKFLEIKDEKEKSFVHDIAYQGEKELNPSLEPAELERLADILKRSGYVPSKRIFLDAEQDAEIVTALLADSDRFNVKHVWSKSSPGWDISNPGEYLDRPLVGASVTRLGILTGGEYVGKDDPVMVGNSKLLSFAHRRMKLGLFIVQGDMNGSHWEAAIPLPKENAVATIRSHPIWVGLRYTVSPDGKSITAVEDIYGDKSYDVIREQGNDWNDALDDASLSQFEFHGANVKTVEASYPLAKMLDDLNHPDSPYLVQNRVDGYGNPVQPWGNPVIHVIRAVPTIGESYVKLEKAL